MAVAIRLKRMGRRHQACYRVAAIDRQRARDSKVIELLGYYHPTIQDPAKQVELKKDRIAYWLSVGAQPSETVKRLLKREGVDAAQAEAKV